METLTSPTELSIDKFSKEYPMDKLVFKVTRPVRTKTDNTIMRLTPEAYNAVEMMSARTGLSNCYLASQMILFAASNSEVEFSFNDSGGESDG